MYSAESIVAALNANRGLICKNIDAIGCPSAHKGCEGDPDNCDLCNSQNCKQPVTVHKNYRKLCVLFFRFMISKSNHGGFIDSDDAALGRLIRHDLIDETMLKFTA